MRHIFTRQFCLFYIVFSSFLAILLFSYGNLFAVKYTTSGRVHQVDGPIEPNDVNQKILRIVLDVGTGGGGATLNSMSFNLIGNTEVAAAKLYFRNAVNDSAFSAAVQIGTTINSPGASITFSGLAASNPTVGNWFYWLVIDANSSISSGVTIDAVFTNISASTVPGFQNNGGAAPPFSIDPAGFRFTSRNYLIGNTGAEQYPTVAATAAAISRFDYDGAADVIMEMTANYANPDESGGTISFLNHKGPASITIRPQAGQTGKVTSGDPGNGAIFMYFGGAQKIILDGRPAGTVTSREWTIRNVRTAPTVASTLVFRDEASYNTFQYLNIEGEGGIISIETTTAAAGTGNDNINFSNCIIRDLTSGGTGTFPFLGINSSGTAGKTNDNIVIDNCQFIDIFNPSITATNSCIFVGANTNSWTITNNHFYQTVSFSGLATNPFAIINITSGGGYTISDNFIGGTGANCGGSAYTISSGTAEFYGIVIGSSVTGAAININGNTFSNIQYTTTMTSSVYPMGAINLNGSANIICGTSGSGNIIGGANNIILTNNSGSGSLGFVGVYSNASGTTAISYNTFSGIIVNGTKAGASSRIINNFSGTTTVNNNTFGTFLNNISISSNSDLFVISNSSANGITCTDNSFEAISHAATTGGFGGIYNSSGNLIATGNIFQNITSSSNSSNGAFFMINHQPSGAGVADIENNIIQDINLTSTGTTVKFFGLSINTATNGNICSNNTVGSTTNNNITLDNNAANYAIYHSLGGTLACNNNIIQEINCTNAGTSTIFDGIFNESTAGAITASGNTIKNIDCATTKVALSLFGIRNISTAAGNLITKNTVENLNLTTPALVNVTMAGINTQAGSGTIEKNFISGLTNSASGATAGIYGCLASGSTWDFYNNIILLDNPSSTGFINGIAVSGTVNSNVYHNTVQVKGTDGSVSSASCLYLSAAGTKSIYNNVFQNLRTGPGKYYAVELGTTAGLTINNNFDEVANNQNQVCYYTSDNTFAQWKTNTGANNDLDGTITLDVTGKVSIPPDFIGAGTGANLTATVTDDKLNITRGIASWMGAYEGQNITTGSISPPSLCAGGAIGVPYTVGGSGSFNGGNIFTAQLSNSSGDFSSPANIGTLASTTSGTISATIPGATPAGSGYRIRVVSSDPIITGSDNGVNTDIATAVPITPTANAATGITCSGFTANWNKTDYNMPGGTINTCSGNFYDNGGSGSGYTNGQNITTTFCSFLGDNITVTFSSFSTEAGFDILEIFDGPNTGSPSLGTYSGTTSPGTIISSGNCLTFRFISDAATTNTGWAATISCTELNTYFLDVATDAGFTAFVTGYNNLDVGNVTSYNVTGLIAGTNYYYRIRSGNGCGTSAYSGTTGPVTASGAQGIYAVTSTANGTTGDGVSLRWAIAQANANCGHDIIRFNLGAGGPFTINLTAALPDLTDPDGVTIDGWNNGVNSGTPNTVAVFNATTATPLNPIYKIILGNGGTVATGLVLASDNNIIQGLVLQDFGDGTVSSNDIAITISGNNNQVLGCYIGMDVTGTTRGTKTADGIVITGFDNEIGDGTAASANLISGMNGSFEGIWINGASATGNTVKGNMLGLQKDGTTVVSGASQFSGIYISNSAITNTIGGSNAGEGNIISGSNGANARGIYLNTSVAGGNKVIGNIIGTCADGVTNVASNSQTYGIMISNSPDNIIGGSSSNERNIISGNLTFGVDITGATSTGNVVKGNYIGINKNGTAIISSGSQDYGIGLISTPSSNTIGGSAAGEGNVISGNINSGIYITSSAAAGNTVLGNIIGPQADGVTYLASNPQSYGVNIDGSPNNTIGGNSSGARNIISGNETFGVYIIIAGSTGNIVKGNYIGTDKNGTSFITGSTQDYGVYIASSAELNTIGGSNAGDGNVISGNKQTAITGWGIYLGSSTTGGNTVIGNIIGPQANGVTYLTSNAQFKGIEINNSPNNTIGGNTAGARNIISANEDYGIYITGASSTGNAVKGNYIGPSNILTDIASSNQDYGVSIISSASGNSIGTTNAGEGNTIAFNSTEAIYILNTGTVGNRISGNSIYDNLGKPININYGVNQGNNGKAAPAITNVITTSVSGTSGASDVIEIFKNNSGNCNNANTYVGTVNADISGNWSAAVSLTQGEYVLATARDGSNNTSEFSSCSPVIVDLYWVGGNGSWNVAGNWSGISGGPGGAGIPDINSNVFIDNNSGAVTITIPSGTWYTKGFTMSGAGSKASVVGQGSLMPRP